MDWITVFNSNDSLNFNYEMFYALIIIGCVLIIASLLLLYKGFKSSNEVLMMENMKLPWWYRLAFTLFLGLLLIFIPFILLVILKNQAKASDINNTAVKVTEGYVKVLNKQNFNGHTPGDSIKVNNEIFVIDYFVLTNFYKNTIARGGVLKEGKHVRIFHLDGDIIRIDVKKE